MYVYHFWHPLAETPWSCPAWVHNMQCCHAGGPFGLLLPKIMKDDFFLINMKDYFVCSLTMHFLLHNFLQLFFVPSALNSVLLCFIRLNLPTTFSMTLEVMGHELQFQQVILYLLLRIFCMHVYFFLLVFFSGVFEPVDSALIDS